jgi:hypothetical protein
MKPLLIVQTRLADVEEHPSGPIALTYYVMSGGLLAVSEKG